MAIIKTSSHLLIIHKIVGKDPSVTPLGDMALETALMLEAHHLDYISRDSGVKLDKSLEIARTNRTNLSWLTRAYMAASHTEPKLATDFGLLTPHGQSLTELAHDVMSKLYNKNEYYAYPHTLDDPDDWFIQLRMPIRSVKLLRIMHRAIEDAPTINRMNNILVQNWDDVVRRYKEEHDPQATQSSPHIPKRPRNEYEAQTPFDLDKTYEAPQDIVTVSVLATDTINPLSNTSFIPNPNPQDSQSILTYVPTSIMGTRGRTDVKQLIKYGLVDVRVMRSGGRGRPKQALQISPIGQKLAESKIVREIERMA